MLALAGFNRADAAVLISTHATQNMSCLAGGCTPTAAKAWLNTGDLETMLASGNTTVKTTGNGVQAKDIAVDAAVAWSSGSTLTLDAYRSVTVNRPVSVQALAGLSVLTNDGGKNGLFLFGPHGNVTFANLSSSLSIDGTPYQLENSIQSLAAAIANNPSGAYALANSYDASQDGTYAASPIPTTFAGTFEGLGNSISNLAVTNDSDGAELGLFADLETTGTLQSVHALNAVIAGEHAQVGALVGRNNGGTIMGVSSSGMLSAPQGVAGGLVGNFNGGRLSFSQSGSKVSAVAAGGLVGQSTSGQIDQSYATGAILSDEHGGGLVGARSGGSISNSYAMGKVKGVSDEVDVGGFAGAAVGSRIASSYSVGVVKGGNQNFRGGFVGEMTDGASFVSCYWDTTTSKKKKGVGNSKDERGVTGLTTEQLQSGLPTGFDPKIWAEDPNVNDGLPYLISNPPK
jgi:hypothetical protein